MRRYLYPWLPGSKTKSGTAACCQLEPGRKSRHPHVSLAQPGNKKLGTKCSRAKRAAKRVIVYIPDNHAGISCKVSSFNMCRSKFLRKVPPVQSSFKLKVPTFAKILCLKVSTFQIPITAKFLLLEVSFRFKVPTVSSFLRVQCSYLSKFFLLKSSFRIR